MSDVSCRQELLAGSMRVRKSVPGDSFRLLCLVLQIDCTYSFMTFNII